MRQLSKSYLNSLTYQITGAAIEVHKAIGPGLLESVYHKCLKRELSLRNISFESEQRVPITFKEETIEANLRCDLLIEKAIVVELKAVEAINPLYEAQILTYMKLLEVPKGILINFNVVNLYAEGHKTYVNNIFRELPE